MMKKLGTFVLTLLVLIVAGLIALRLWVRAHPGGQVAGSTSAVVETVKATVESWCGDQIMRVANHFLGPEVSFDSLTYVQPRTVVLKNVKLVEGDVEVLWAASMKVEFARVPRVGEPITISVVELAEPVVRLVERNDAWVGFGDLVETTEGEVYDDGGSTRLSDVFEISRIAFINGSVSLEPEGDPPMKLDQLTLSLDASAVGDEAGWYDIDAAIDRPEILELVLKAQYGMAEQRLHINDGQLGLHLDESRYDRLPASTQKILRQHEVTGSFSLTATGDLFLQDATRNALDVKATLSDGRIALEEYALPVEWLELTARVNGQRLKFEPLYAHVMGGTMTFEGWIDGTEGTPTSFTFDAADVHLEQAVRGERKEGDPIPGIMNANGRIDARLAELPASLSGNGQLSMHDGVAFGLDFVDNMFAFMKINEEKGSRGSSRVVLTGTEAQFEDIELKGTTAAAEGAGRIGWDSSVYFRFTGGPIRGSVEDVLGPIGEMLGKVTDNLVAYEITGTTSKTETKVLPLGIGGK